MYKNCNLYWIGPRESDTNMVSFLHGSITLFGSGKNCNSSYDSIRVNHNKLSEDIDKKYHSELEQLLIRDSKAKFICYNPKYVQFMTPEMLSRTICLNDSKLISFLNNKIKSREWFSSFVDVPQSAVFKSSDITYDNLKKHFGSRKSFVIQNPNSSGGYGTYIVDDMENQSFENGYYLVSAYLENSFSINTHIIIDKTNIHLFPISIQLIEKVDGKLLFKGTDFISFKFIDSKIKKEIYDKCKLIGEKLRNIGYFGIAGLDFTICDDGIYLMEINPRFQSSSMIINCQLSNENITLQELNMMAFLDIDVKYDYSDLNVMMSSYHYDFNMPLDRLKYKYNQLCSTNEIIVYDDGYSSMSSDCVIEEGAYAFHAIFPYNISSVNHQNKLRIFDNIKIDTNLHGNIDENPVMYKIAILNQGISITKEALCAVGTKGFREGVFSSIDVRINDLYINCPININHSELSPFSLDYDAGYLLRYYEKEISRVEVYDPICILDSGKTTNGVDFGLISLIATDRLRIRYESSCKYKDNNEGCAFCESFPRCGDFYIEDLIETYDACSQLDFRHVLIGGGSGHSLSKIKSIVEYIHKNKPDMPISLMSTPFLRDEMIELHECGVSDVSFNIEIFDSDLAIKIMPGKGKIQRGFYYDRLRDAVEIFGKGNVRSMVVLGFDDFDHICEGIECLCSIGVQPVLSIFRPMPNTPLEYEVPPENQEIIRAYDASNEICSRHGISLGPSCKACQNNVVSFPFNIHDH